MKTDMTANKTAVLLRKLATHKGLLFPVLQVVPNKHGTPPVPGGCSGKLTAAQSSFTMRFGQAGLYYFARYNYVRGLASSQCQNFVHSVLTRW